MTLIGTNQLSKPIFVSNGVKSKANELLSI